MVRRPACALCRLRMWMTHRTVEGQVSFGHRSVSTPAVEFRSNPGSGFAFLLERVMHFLAYPTQERAS
jgi:hypothetical protein